MAFITKPSVGKVLIAFQIQSVKQKYHIQMFLKKHAACQHGGCALIHNFLSWAIVIVSWLESTSSGLSI